MAMSKILIIDDDPAIRELYETGFKQIGYDVQVAINGEDALSKTLAFKPNLLLLDIMMPEIHGLHVLDIIKATPEAKDMKVVVFTALSDDEAQKKAKEFGADGYIVKSQKTMAEVINYVQETLDKG